MNARLTPPDSIPAPRSGENSSPRPPVVPRILFSPPPPEPSNVSTAEKVTLYRRLFRGRTDSNPVHWESANCGKSSYATARANEWRLGIYEKPRIKCTVCNNRSLTPLHEVVIYRHLAGQKIVGVSSLLPDHTCYFDAVDLKKAEWREDAKAFPSMPCAERARQFSLASYDRLLSNQVAIPKGGFGNLIGNAADLTRSARQSAGSMGLITSMPQFSKSTTFRVATEKWLRRAIAAV